jgi:hypothetical protein
MLSEAASEMRKVTVPKRRQRLVGVDRRAVGDLYPRMAYELSTLKSIGDLRLIMRNIAIRIA